MQAKNTFLDDLESLIHTHKTDFIFGIIPYIKSPIANQIGIIAGCSDRRTRNRFLSFIYFAIVFATLSIEVFLYAESVSHR